MNNIHKKIKIIIGIIVLLLTVFSIFSFIKDIMPIATKGSSKLLGDGLIFNENEDNNIEKKEIFQMIKYDVQNNTSSYENVIIENISGNKLTGYIPPQNADNDYSSNSYEKEEIGIPNKDNVSLEIEESTLSKNGVVLIITDKNETQYGWGDEYKIQREENKIWVDVKYKVNPLWNDIGREFDKNGQYRQRIDWSNIYGELESGKYRLLKRVYDPSEEEYIEFSVEFVLNENS